MCVLYSLIKYKAKNNKGVIDSVPCFAEYTLKTALFVGKSLSLRNDRASCKVGCILGGLLIKRYKNKKVFLNK